MRRVLAIVLMFCAWPPLAGRAQGPAASETPQAAQAVQNPFSSLTMVILQNNTNFRQGANRRTHNIFMLQPMVPTRVNDGWSLSTWVNVPLAYQPNVSRVSSGAAGLGDVQPMFFFSPLKTSKLVWGAGPSLLLPTATDPLLQTGRFSVGPALLVLVQPGRWTLGAMTTQLFSVGGPSSRKAINKLSLNPFANFNLADGWFLTSQPGLSADWKMKGNRRWTVPLGGGAGRIVNIGPQLVNTSVAAYYNAMRDLGAARWQLAVQFFLLYPK